MSYTWLQFKSQVKGLMSDASITNDSAVVAIAEYVRANVFRDFSGNLDLYKVHSSAYGSARQKLLGFSITLSDSALKAAVRLALTDATIDDTLGARAVAEYVQWQIEKDLRQNMEAAKVYQSNYSTLRNRLLGYTITMTDNNLKAAVKGLITDIVPSDTTAVQAVAEYVKYKICREVNHDVEEAASYFKTYTMQKIKLVGYTISISGSTLRTAVDKLITTDANRLGINESGAFIDKCILEAVADIVGFDTYLTNQIAQAKADIAGLATYIDAKILLAKADIISFGTNLDLQIRQAVIDLQSHIPLYRAGHETVFTESDVAEEGSTSHGNLPEQCQIRDAYFVTITTNSDDEEVCLPAPLKLYDWGQRFNLINGDECINAAQFYLCLNPERTKFYVYPALDETHKLSIFWTGLKFEFSDSDATPFDEAMSLAVVEYVLKGKSSSEYLTSRRRLIIDAKDRGRMSHG